MLPVLFLLAELSFGQTNYYSFKGKVCQQNELHCNLTRPDFCLQILCYCCICFLNFLLSLNLASYILHLYPKFCYAAQRAVLFQSAFPVAPFLSFCCLPRLASFLLTRGYLDITLSG